MQSDQLCVLVENGPSLLDYLTFGAAVIAVGTAAWAAAWTRHQGLAAMRQARAAVGPVMVVESYGEDGCELTNHGPGVARILDGVIGSVPLKFESVVVSASRSTRAAATPRRPSDLRRPTGSCVVLSSDVSGTDFYVTHAWRPSGSGIAFLALDVEGPLAHAAAVRRFARLSQGE